METIKNVALWKHFKKAPNEKAVCNECQAQLDNTAGTTSGMIKHLRCKHATLFQHYLDTKKTNSKPSKRKSECLDKAELKLKQPKLSFLDNSENLNKTIDTSIVNFIA